MLDGIWHLDQVPPPAELILSGNDMFLPKGGVPYRVPWISCHLVGKMARKPAAENRLHGHNEPTKLGIPW